MKGTILIVDDEETLRHFLGRALEGEGYRVLEAARAEEGLRLVREESVDLVLLDMRLPDLDGLEVLRRIRESGREPLVIILTSDGGPEVGEAAGRAQEAMRLGAQDYLQKPLDLELLKEKITVLLDKKFEAQAVSEPRFPSEEVETAEEAFPSFEQGREIRRLRAGMEEAARLEALSSSLAGAEEVSQVAEMVLSAAGDWGGAGRAALWVWVEPKRKYFLVGQKNIPGPELAMLEGLKLFEEIKEPMLIQGHSLDFLGTIGPRAGEEALLLPLFSARKRVGAMLVLSHPGRPISPQQKSRLGKIGLRAGESLSRLFLIGELRAERQRLLGWETWLQSALLSMGQAVLVSGRDGRIRLVNPQAEEMLGYAVKELVGRPLTSVLGVALPENWAQGLFLARREARIARKDGGEVTAEVDLRLLRNRAGDPLGLVAVLQDRAAPEEEGLPSWGEMSRVIAHEIRNSLAGITIGVQHLLGKTEPGGETAESLGLILKEAERVNRIIEEILIVSRPVRLTLGSVNLRSVLDGAVAANRPRLERAGIRLVKHLPPGLPVITADAQRLGQALATVVKRAAEDMPQGGELRLLVLGGSQDQEVEIIIQHPGVEMREGTHPRAGLALAATKRIIEAHGGEVSQEKDMFIVRLPLRRI